VPPRNAGKQCGDQKEPEEKSVAEYRMRSIARSVVVKFGGSDRQDNTRDLGL